MLSSKSARHTGPSPYAEGVRGGPFTDVVRLKIALIEIVPPVWRRLTVPANLTLRRLHAVLQRAMGWEDLHPHRFRVGETLLGKPENFAGLVKDSRWVTIHELVSAGTRTLLYEYGPDGRWIHEVWIEGVGEGTPTNQRPACLSGERACPPEASSGPDDYVDHILGDRDPLGRLEPRPKGWPQNFDPEHFDVEEANASIATLIL